MRADETALCQSCGLCCDGTLFGRVPLTEHDLAPALANVQTSPRGGRFIPQRCAALEGTSCGCYGERPTACRQFECTLLVALRDGEVPVREAQQLVQRAKQLTGEAQKDFLKFHFGRR